MKMVWIPEAPEHPGLYANHNGTDLDTGKIRGMVKQPSTMSPHHALQFATREECQAWCDANPHPVFVPVEHGFDAQRQDQRAGARGPGGTMTVVAGSAASPCWAPNQEKP